MIEIVQPNNINLQLAVSQGPAGQGLPAGGTSGQFLVKESNTDFDYVWKSPQPIGQITFNTESTAFLLANDRKIHKGLLCSVIDSDRTIIVFSHSDGTNESTYAVVHSKTSGYGGVTLISTQLNFGQSCLVDTLDSTRVLVSCPRNGSTTEVAGLVLSVTGSVITVNTTTYVALASNTNIFYYKTSSGYIFNQGGSSLSAINISGASVSFSTSVSVASSARGAVNSNGVLVIVNAETGILKARVASVVSGAITLGTAIDVVTEAWSAYVLTVDSLFLFCSSNSGKIYFLSETSGVLSKTNEVSLGAATSQFYSFLKVGDNYVLSANSGISIFKVSGTTLTSVILNKYSTSALAATFFFSKTLNKFYSLNTGSDANISEWTINESSVYVSKKIHIPNISSYITAGNFVDVSNSYSSKFLDTSVSQQGINFPIPTSQVLALPYATANGEMGVRWISDTSNRQFRGYFNTLDNILWSFSYGSGNSIIIERTTL